MIAPEIDSYLRYSKQNPLIEDPVCVARLTDIFELLDREFQTDIIAKAFWYPEKEVKPKDSDC